MSKDLHTKIEFAGRSFHGIDSLVPMSLLKLLGEIVFFVRIRYRLTLY